MAMTTAKAKYINVWAAWAAAAILGAGLSGCASSPGETGGFSESFSRPATGRPMTAAEITRHPDPVKGTLPLGIGASINVFMAETYDDAEMVYTEVVKPMSKGRIFANKPYALDYAVRDRGDAFSEDVKLSRLEIQSNYDIRIGMSRRFHDFNDFLNPSFWLAEGRFAPVGPRPHKKARSLWNPLFDSEADGGEIGFGDAWIDYDAVLGAGDLTTDSR
ncbi:MAG: hypothetical protein GC154_03945 [bacterium]|nr:hypothetical protein [bacterium]